MGVRKWVYGVLTCAFVVILLGGTGQARFTNKDGTLEVKGKISSKVSVRTQDSKGFTAPETDVGDVVQHRNLAYVELTHELGEFSNFRVKYHLVGRLLYEGIYDYGPEQFRDVADQNEEVFDDFKKDADLWEAYADFTGHSMFLRLGRQNVSWGETDIFQLLDRINPLDNTYGGAFEDLSDRRIPIWMARMSYNVGNVGPISSFTLEGFWNPGFLDQKVAPASPFGTPYSFPAPPPQVATRTIEPEDDMEGSRAGIRWLGVIADNFNVQFAHYRTILDNTSARLVLDPDFTPVFEFKYETVQITGGALNFFEPHLDAVFRTEVAWHWEEPVFIPEVSAPVLFGNFVSGEVPEKDVLRFMVAMEKNFWFRPLNRTSMFNMNFQYFGEYYPNYDERMRLPAPHFPDGAFVTVKEYEHKFTLYAYTYYKQGTINPDLAFVWDPRGAYLVIPTVTFIYEPWRLKLGYVGVYGDDDVGVGFFHDRDQAFLTLELLF